MRRECYQLFVDTNYFLKDAQKNINYPFKKNIFFEASLLNVLIDM